MPNSPHILSCGISSLHQLFWQSNWSLSRCSVIKVSDTYVIQIAYGPLHLIYRFSLTLVIGPFVYDHMIVPDHEMYLLHLNLTWGKIIVATIYILSFEMKLILVHTDQVADVAFNWFLQLDNGMIWQGRGHADSIPREVGPGWNQQVSD